MFKIFLFHSPKEYRKTKKPMLQSKMCQAYQETNFLVLGPCPQAGHTSSLSPPVTTTIQRTITVLPALRV